MDYIMDLYWVDGIDLIVKALTEREKQKSWEMWLSQYPQMTKDTFVPFSKFYQGSIAPTAEVTRKTPEELLAEAKEIRRKLNK